MINIQIQKKDLWLLATIVVFITGVTYVIAYNAAMGGGNPAVMGHSSDEIMVMNKTGSLVSLQQYINQGAGGIACDWAGWKGAMTFGVKDGSKYTSMYWTTIFKCESGKITQVKYLRCTDANNATYNAGIDCSN